MALMEKATPITSTSPVSPKETIGTSLNTESAEDAMDGFEEINLLDGETIVLYFQS